MVDILLEIGTEEIPARFVSQILAEIKKNTEKQLQLNRLKFQKVQTFGTDRRLALIVENLAEQQADLDSEIKGPPLEIAYQNGQLTAAGMGFCKKNNLDPQQVEQKEFAGKRYLFAKVFQKGKLAKQILPEIYQTILSELYLPIAMKWGDLDQQFIRPIHWLVCLYDQQLLPFEFAGIRATTNSYGHRFFSNQSLVISSSQDYFTTLEKNKVLVDHHLRKDTIISQIKIIEKKLNLKAVYDENLINELTFLNEYPVALTATIDQKYLSIPQECLILTMQKNQKYIPLVDHDNNLTKNFILITNNFNEKSANNIIKGNVKVVTARLEDARFFYEEDLKVNMEHWVNLLANVTYHEKIGSVQQKINRIIENSKWLCQAVNFSKSQTTQALRAAQICKADLESKMVYEFPELQGVMGKYYAQAAGEPKPVCEAILDHWKPRFSGEAVNDLSSISAVVAIADKLDSICSCYLANLIPTGSSDPYALRRAAQGIVNIIDSQDFKLDLNALIVNALNLLTDDKNKIEKVLQEIKRLFYSRIKYLLQEKNIAYDITNTVLAEKFNNDTDIFVPIKLADLIGKYKYSQRPIFDAYLRITNILNNFSDFPELAKVYPTKYETSLYQKYLQIRQLVDKHYQEGLLEQAFLSLGELVDPINELFDQVMINDENLQIRKQRLNLLANVWQTFSLLCKDASQLVYN